MGEFTDVTQVEKFEISAQAYEKRTGAIRLMFSIIVNIWSNFYYFHAFSYLTMHNMSEFQWKFCLKVQALNKITYILF